MKIKPKKATNHNLVESRSLTLVDKISRFSSNNIWLVLIWVVVVFLSSLITLYQGVKLVREIYESSIGEKRIVYSKLASLTPNVNISHYIDLFGNPSIIHTNQNGKEYIFIDDRFYLQAITDGDGMTKFFSVTSRKKDFQPTFSKPGYLASDPEAFIILNKTTFTDENKVIKKEDSSFRLFGKKESTSPECDFYIGANRFNYFEAEYLANPGNYQTLYLGINDAGYYEIDNPEVYKLWNIIFEEGKESCLDIPTEFRAKNVINTYGESGSFEIDLFNSTDSGSYRVGADLAEVRVSEK